MTNKEIAHTGSIAITFPKELGVKNNGIFVSPRPTMCDSAAVFTDVRTGITTDFTWNDSTKVLNIPSMPILVCPAHPFSITRTVKYSGVTLKTPGPWNYSV
jgi:hypothetical protein